MVLALQIVIASVAVGLILLSLKTLQTIKHLGVGKSFWMPVALSGFLFFFGSIVAILFELNFTLTEYTNEVVQVSQLLALCILVSGVYSYSRKITRDLGEKFILSEKAVKSDNTVEMEARAVSPPATTTERTVKRNFRKESEDGCRYQFGYLRTLPADASIPDECLSCDKIIKCKHSPVKIDAH